jgi:hypothetical protein
MCSGFNSGRTGNRRQATDGTGREGRECLTLEAERRRQKRRRRNPGTTMGAMVVVPAMATATLLAGGTVPPSQTPPAHVIVHGSYRNREGT